ncbi:hypothetical protein [Marimonas arenosa]|uniref:Uncharacterized protein n=1 Tax=Marimonas arenosa TaxID=1795305 RepID=A0AAE3W9B6_9RHOB|nr:hypothetical protein [Marimonas arenosa]MDQ2088751.1 hypothetical protein [Marimonas arenosa]
MEDETFDAEVYVVTLWCEHREQPGPPLWRGSARCVESGALRHFRSLAGLGRALHELAPGFPEDDERGE